MIAVRLLVLALGVALGVFYPFIAVILQGFGFSAGEIGVIASIGAVGFTIAVPAWGHLADVRLGRPRTLQVCAIGAGLAIVALLLPWPAPVIAVLFAVFWVFESSWQPLADAVTVNALRGRDYGRVRLLTSLSFAIGTIVAGFIYNVTGYAAAFVLFGLAALSMAVIAARVPDVQRADLAAHARRAGASASDAARRSWSGSAGVALRVAPRLALVLTAATMLFVGVIAGFTFLPLRLEAIGGSPSDIALASGLAAAAEIPTMLVAAAVARIIGLRGMFVGSALIYAAALASWTVLDDPIAIIATRALSGDRVRRRHRGRRPDHRGPPAGRPPGDRAVALPDERLRARRHRGERRRRDPVRLARTRRRVRPGRGHGPGGGHARLVRGPEGGAPARRARTPDPLSAQPGGGVAG